MYRHFAVVTLGITFCLAIFADGENRQALAEKAEQRRAENEMLRAEKEAVGEKKLASTGLKFRDGRSLQGSFAPDPGPPAENHVSYSSGPDLPPQRFAMGSLEPPAASEREIGLAYDTPDVLPPGMSEEEMRKFILKRKGEKTKKRATEEELEQILEASRQRSGATENGDDD